MWSPWSEEGGGEAGGWEQMAAGDLELRLHSPLDQDPRQELEPSTALHSEQPVRWRGSLSLASPHTTIQTVLVKTLVQPYLLQ